MKTIILLMSCDNEFFINEEKLVKQTWLKPVIDGQYPDIDYYFYKSGDKQYIDFDNHYIYVNTADDWISTFLKTQEALKVLNENVDFDFIVKTNLSTYINIQMINVLMQSNVLSDYKDVLFGGRLIKRDDIYYPTGSFMLFSKLLSMQIAYSKISEQREDDYIIGKILNKYKKHIFDIPNINKSPYHRLSEIDETLYNNIAVIYRVFEFDMYDKDISYKLREVLETHMLNKLHKQMSKQMLTSDHVMNCLNYKNTIYFEHCVGFKEII